MPTVSSMEQSPSWEDNISSVKRFSAFYGTRRFITAFTTASHLSLSWARSIQSMPVSHFLKTHFNIILPSTPVYYKWSLSITFSNRNPVCTSPLFHKCHMPLLSHYSWFDHPNYIRWAVQIIKFLVTYSSQLPYHLAPFRPKYPPQHPILERPQPMCLPRCERPRFTPIQDNRQHCSSVYLNLYSDEQQTGRQKFVHQTTVSISWVQSALTYFINANIWSFLALINKKQNVEIDSPAQAEAKRSTWNMLVFGLRLRLHCQFLKLAFLLIFFYWEVI